jgi:MFS family permease
MFVCYSVSMNAPSHAPLKKLLPFWVFVLCFKLAAGLHFALLSVLGERVFPLWTVGLLIGGAALFQVCLDVPAGYLLDRFGYVRMMRIGTWFFIVGAGTLLFGLTPLTYPASIILATIGWLFYTPGVNAYVLLKAEKRTAGTFVAAREVSESSGIVIGTLLLPVAILLSAPLVGLFLIMVFLVAFAALSFTPLDEGSVHAEKKIAHQSYYVRRHFLHDVFRAISTSEPASVLLMLSGFSGSIFYGIVWFVVPLVLAHMTQAGPLNFGLIVFDASVLVTGFLIGRITDSRDKRWLVFWGLLLFAISGLFLGVDFGVWFLVLGFLATTGDEISSISLWAWLGHLHADHERDALVSGSISLCDDLGWAIGPVIAGILFESVGPAWTIAVGAGFIFLTWLISTLRLSTLRHPAMSLLPAGSLPAHTPRRQRHKK